MIHSREAHISVDRMQDSCREELLKHLRKLVSKLEGKKLSETELEGIFQEKWTEWMQDFTAKLPMVYQQDVNIDATSERCLRDLLRKHNLQIIMILSRTPLRMWGQTLQLAIQPDKHLRSLRWFKGIQEEDIELAKVTNERFLETAKQYLQDLKKKRIRKFSDGYIYGLFNKVFEDVNQFNQEKNKFKFTPEYTVDVALTVAGYALRHFEEMIKKENDPIEYLKVPFFNTFKSQYCQIGKEKTAADNLCYLLRKPIVTAVTGSLVCMIADDMMGLPIFHSKQALKCRILLDLGEKSSFQSFVFYLTDAKASLQQWVELYTEQHCAQVVGGKSKLEETKLHEVIASITEAVKDVTHCLPLTKKASISDWLSKLHQQLKCVLKFDEKEMKDIVGAENLKDFHFFTEEIIKGLHKMQVLLLDNFQSSPLRWIVGASALMIFYVMPCLAVVSSAHSVENSVS